MMRAIVFGVALAACGGGTPPAATPAPRNHTAPAPDPKVRAREALHDEERLDYQRPFDGRAVEHTRSTALYVDACRGGDKPSCWLAMTVASEEQWQATALLVAANCKAGDVMSCRALPVDHDNGKVQFPALPGAATRSTNCETIDEHTACDIAAVRQECTAGFAPSCRVLSMARVTPSDTRELMARAIELANAGCQSDIVSDCQILGTFGTDEQKVQAVTRVCEFSHVWCDGIGVRALTAGKRLEARDAYERACQFASGREYDCVDLGVRYLDHKLDEPVAGRGQALVDWGCARMVQRRGKEKTERDTPDCKRAQLNK